MSISETFPFLFTRWMIPLYNIFYFLVLVYILRPEKKVLKNSLMAGFSLSIFNFIWETANVLRVLAAGLPIDAGYIGGYTLLWTGLETFPVFTLWGAMFCLILYKLKERKNSAIYIVPLFLFFATYSTYGDYNMVQVGNAYVPSIMLPIEPYIWILWFGFFIILDMFFWMFNEHSKTVES